MTTALVYVRKSVVKSNKPTLSPQRQQEACIEYCDQHGWEYEVYADAEGHRSGRSEKGRPEWLRLKSRLELSHPGEIVAVVVYSLDRSSRSTRDFLNFLQLLQERKTDFVSVTQPFLDTTSAVGRAFMGMISIWSELEANMDSERVTADIAYRQESGLHFGHCPIGYTRQSINGERVPVPNEDAPKVVQAWEAYATGEHSYRSLARWINNELQLRTMGGDVWTHKHVQIMFDNHAFYTGWVTRHRKRGSKEKYRGKHQAIISDELAEKVLAVRSDKESQKFKSHRPDIPMTYLLTPILHCDCGVPMRGFPSHGVATYKHNGPKCNYSTVHAEQLDRQFLNLFEGWQLPEDLEKAIEADLKRQSIAQQMSDADGEKVRKLETQRERSLRLFELGARDEDWLKTKLLELDEAIAKLTPKAQMPYNVRNLAAMVRQFGEMMSDGETPKELLKPLVFAMFERVNTNGEDITSVTPRRWFADFFRNARDMGYPQGNIETHDVAKMKAGLNRLLGKVPK